jgi:hypothetical protein
MGNVSMGRATLDPRWSWEKSVKPIKQPIAAKLYILSI